MTTGVNDERAEIVVEGAGIKLITDAGLPGEFADLVRRPGQKTPMLRVILITIAVGFEQVRRVKLRVEGEGKQMLVGGSAGQGFEFLLRCLEVFRQPRAIIGQGTAGVKKGDGQRLPAKIVQAHRPAQFVGELVVQQRMIWPDGRKIGRLFNWRQGNRSNFADLIHPTLRFSDLEPEGNFIAPLQAGQFF